MSGSLKVDWRKSVALTGMVINALAVTMLVPVAVALVYGDGLWTFLASMAIVVVVGLGLEQLDSGKDLGPREALLFVSLAWLAVAVFGAIPYVIAGYGTASTLASPINALFESMSGFTTTGATVMGDISFETHSRAIMMWRQLTQWLGGMGIIVLMVAILPEVAVNGAQLMESEAPGPHLQKLTPRIAETARALWGAYLAFTVLYIALLYGLHLSGFAPGMDFYDAVAHGFTTLPTGGFSPEADSIAAYSAAVQWLVIPFMVVAGTNFALFWHVFEREFHYVVEDHEFRAYVGALGALTAVTSVLLFFGGAPTLTLGGVTQGVFGNSVRQAAFQVVSLMTSTGYASSDFAQWGTSGQLVLLFAMFIGGSAGSTGGGIKVIRWLIIVKAAKRELFTTSHPDAVRPIRLGGTIVDEDAIRAIMAFSLFYLAMFAVAVVLISVDASRVGLTLTPLEAISASIATLGNIGPGFGLVGPFGSYLKFPATTKVLFVFLMWIGRLEILPVLVVFTGGFWNK
ncbi:MAG: TrkH family potassium uptake protein [Halopenitus sp.]